MVETIRISQKAKDQLIGLKKHTGIQNWNVLCRWAFCQSLAESSPPRDVEISLDSSVEMTWKVFGGKYQELYWALLKAKCEEYGYTLDDDTLTRQFKLHLHRGISYLAANKKIESTLDLIQKAV